jgi:hypothetical protein
MFAIAQSLGRPPLPRLFVISGRVHVSQNHRARIDRSPLTRVNMYHPKLFDGIGNFSYATLECGGNRRAALAAVHRSQRLDPALGLWNDSFAARTQRTRKQPVEPFCREIRQIAGDDQIPRRASCGQRSGDSRERSTSESIRPALALHVISDHMQSEPRVSIWRSDNCDFSDKWLEQSRSVKNQGNVGEIEKSLVAAHARTGASSENKASDLAIALHDCPAILRLSAGLAQRYGEL